MELKIPKHLKKSSVAPKPVRKGRVIKSSSGRYVLFLGDEGAILVYLKGSVVQSRQFISDASEQNLREFRQTINKDTHAPLMLVVDSMDQSYMQQTLPPVSVISVNKLIKRRLERDFSGNEIKGAILLGREKTGRKDWSFLMVALENSPQLSVWLDFIQELPNRFSGIYLASVESEMLVYKLERAMGTYKEEGAAEWKFFISHNKVGGFRQVIMKNGRIIFTRLAQPIGDSDAEVIAGSIEQEMLSTIEYMKRLSFSPQSKVDIYIVTSSSIKAVLDPSKFNANMFHVLTPYELAQYLGIEGAAQPTDQFGDVVMAAVIGSSKKHVLRLAAPQTKRIDQYYQMLGYQRVAAAVTICGILGYGGYIGSNIVTLMGETSDLDTKKKFMQQSLDTLRRDIAKSNFDVEKASDLVDLYKQLMQEKLSPLPMLRKFEALAQAPVWIKSFDWSIISGDIPSAVPAARTPPTLPLSSTKTSSEPSMLAKIMLEFPQEANDVKKFKVLTQKVLDDFKAQFKGYEVAYTKTPESAENDKLEIRSGVAQDTTVKSLELEMTIKGNLSLLAEPAPEIKAAPTIIAPAIPTPEANKGKTP